MTRTVRSVERRATVIEHISTRTGLGFDEAF